MDDLRHNCEMKLRDLQKKKGQILEDLQENRKHYDKESIFKSLEIFKNYKDIKEQINITKNDMIRIQKHPRYKISQRIIEDIIRKKREEMISKRGEDKSKEHD